MCAVLRITIARGQGQPFLHSKGTSVGGNSFRRIHLLFNNLYALSLPIGQTPRSHQLLMYKQMWWWSLPVLGFLIWCQKGSHQNLQWRVCQDPSYTWTIPFCRWGRETCICVSATHAMDLKAIAQRCEVPSAITMSSIGKYVFWAVLTHSSGKKMYMLLHS